MHRMSLTKSTDIDKYNLLQLLDIATLLNMRTSCKYAKNIIIQSNGISAITHIHNNLLKYAHKDNIIIFDLFLEAIRLNKLRTTKYLCIQYKINIWSRRRIALTTAYNHQYNNIIGWMNNI
jgi:hypothetical protein